MATVLIVDDEPTLRALMSRVIELEGYHVLQATTIKDALKILNRENVQVVISDVKLPDGNGVDLAAKLKTEFPAIEIIVLTAYGTIEDGVRAIKNGAFDYLTKGDHQDKILPLLSKAVEKAGLQQKVISLESRLQKKFGFDSIVGRSPILRSAIETSRKVSATDSNVLLLGETGTGKEVFARAIHYESPRKSKPFVALNCSAFSKDLIESELFGHAEGSFTGAAKAKKGLVEEAEGGTLFMDEIGEMPLDLQAKVLRLVEAHEFYRVGETKVRRTNLRIIAATNRNLEKEVEQGNFREDLYYRLSVFTIHLPPLRDRIADIEDLVKDFVAEFSLKTNKPVLSIGDGFVETLRKHEWKGNVRELKNVIERSVILTDSNELTALSLPHDFSTNLDDRLDLASVEKRHIQKVLRHTNGNKTQAARLLDIGLTTLYQKIKDYNL
jgi:DNA-binding NtrC family response regulator